MHFASSGLAPVPRQKSIRVEQGPRFDLEENLVEDFVGTASISLSTESQVDNVEAVARDRQAVSDTTARKESS